MPWNLVQEARAQDYKFTVVSGLRGLQVLTCGSGQVEAATYIQLYSRASAAHRMFRRQF